MARFADTLLDEVTTAPIAGALIYIFSDGLPASLTDDSGAALPQPIITPQTGAYYFNAPDAVYQRKVYVGARLKREDDIIVGEPDAFKGPPGGNVMSTGPAVQLPTVAVPVGTNLVITDSYNGDAQGSGPWQVGATPPAGYTQTTAKKVTANNRTAMIPRDQPVQLSRLGVKYLSTSDQTAAIMAALADAADAGLTLHGNPYAQYRKDGVLTFDGMSFDGQGCSFMPLSNGSQAVVIVGDGLNIRNFRTLSAATVRQADIFRNGVTIGIAGSSGRTATNVTLQDVTVDTVGSSGSTKRGAGNAGIQLSNAFRVKLVRPKVISSLADGINVTGGSQDIWVDSPIVDLSGDDAFSTNSYTQDGALVSRVWLSNGFAYNPLARGGAIVGGRDVRFEYEVIGSSGAAGYIASEATSDADTYGTENCHIRMTARGAVTGTGLDPSFQNAVAIISGRAGSDTIGGVPFSRQARNCSVTGAFYEVGARCSAIGDLTSAASVRCWIDMNGGNAVGSSLMPVGVQLGGTDCAARVHADTLGGIAYTLAGSAATGAAGRFDLDLSFAATQSQGVVSGGINAVGYVEAAPNLTRLNVTGTFNNSSPTWLALSGLDPNTIFWKDVILNGAPYNGKTYKQAVITFANGWTASTTEVPQVLRFDAGSLRIEGQLITPSTFNAIIGKTPSGFRPTTAQVWSGTTNGGQGILIKWDVDGTLSLPNATAAGTAAGQAGPDIRFNNYACLEVAP